VQMRRPSVWEVIEEMRGITTPTLIISGDDDDPCLEPSLLLKRTIPGSGLLVLPRGGHAINLEEPDGFNRAVGDFLHTVECGRW
jgi:pimeloyl-ACP methyl ester carboxylesterase